jgi:hypothetical protein
MQALMRHWERHLGAPALPQVGLLGHAVMLLLTQLRLTLQYVRSRNSRFLL